MRMMGKNLLSGENGQVFGSNLLTVDQIRGFICAIGPCDKRCMWPGTAVSTMALPLINSSFLTSLGVNCNTLSGNRRHWLLNMKFELFIAALSMAL